jgi:hypothetical protein
MPGGDHRPGAGEGQRQRYQTGAEMAADLRACMGLGTGGSAPAPQVDFNL